MSRKTRIELSLVAELDHDIPAFNIKSQRDGHIFINSIKEMLKEIVSERKIKFMLEKSDALLLEDPEEKIPDLKKLYLENEILRNLVSSLDENTGTINLKVVKERPKRP